MEVLTWRTKLLIPYHRQCRKFSELKGGVCYGGYFFIEFGSFSKKIFSKSLQFTQILQYLHGFHSFRDTAST